MTRDQVDKIAAHAAAGWSLKEMAATVGATVGQVRYQIRKLGLGDRHRRRPKRATVRMALKARGWSLSTIRRVYRMSDAQARALVAWRREVCETLGLPASVTPWARLRTARWKMKPSVKAQHAARMRAWRAANPGRRGRPPGDKAKHAAYMRVWRSRRTIERTEAMVAEAD